MRADRLLAIILLLQRRSPRTAGELASILEVSERTIYRDMDVLSGRGIPIYADRGHQGGFAMSPGFELGPQVFTTAELWSLLISRTPGPLKDLGINNEIENAHRKLTAVLQPHGAAMIDLEQQIHLDTEPWWHQHESVDCLPDLQQVIAAQQQILICYENKRGEIKERKIHPYGLVAKTSTWYLVAATADGMRVFRASRIQSLTVTEQKFERDPSFDLARFWRNWYRGFETSLPTYEAIFRMKGGMESRLKNHSLVPLEWQRRTNEDDYDYAKITFETIEQACIFALQWGSDVEALEPHELRDRVTREVEELHLSYCKKSNI